jgi:hypothetical protein
MITVCKNHKENPVKGYVPCPGCEIERLMADIDRMKEAIEYHLEFNRLANDKDAFLYNICEWGLGRGEKPKSEDFGI